MTAYNSEDCLSLPGHLPCNPSKEVCDLSESFIIMARLFLCTFLLSASILAHAIPTSFRSRLPATDIRQEDKLGAAAKRQSITALSSTQISAFKPFSFFASAAYCQPSTTINWSCGSTLFPIDGLVKFTDLSAVYLANCNNNPGFEPTTSGGDGTDTQFCVALHNPSASNLTYFRFRVCRL